jgi:nitric oxide dioxygenase
MTYITKIEPIMLAPESRAIVRATAPAILSSKAAIRFRMWHNLQDEPQRRGLFEEFVAGKEVLGLIEALVECGEQYHSYDPPRLARRLAAQEHARLHHALKPALRRALKDVLGASATEAVLNAWGETFSYLLAETA